MAWSKTDLFFPFSEPEEDDDTSDETTDPAITGNTPQKYKIKY